MQSSSLIVRPLWSRRRLFRSAAGILGLSRLSHLLADNGTALFEEIPAKKSGITFVHDNAMSPEHYLPETVGSGCAFFDFDNDGWMDIYLVNSGPCDFFKPKTPLHNALYKNNRDGTFTDVTNEAGVLGGTFGMGVAAGDYDNDGFPDLFLTSYGRCVLYHNNGDGTFTDVTEKAEVAAPGWTTSAVWLDYDNDGYLDLFVCSFVEFGVGTHVGCGANKSGKNYYCVPRVFKPTSNLLFHNNGDGTFREVSSGTEIKRALGKALGVVATDVNNDGRMDLFVANDTVQNFLFVNGGNNSWEETGLFAEVAFSAEGQARSGMGVDAADLNQDGYQDLFVANIDLQMFSLYTNRGDGTFVDDAHRHGISQATRLLSGWGLRFFDYDNDGELDLLLANGHPDDMVSEYAQNVQYKEPLLLFHHEKEGLRNISEKAGPVFQRSLSARGMAIGDHDNDGAIDVVSNNGDTPLLLRNRAAQGSHWIGLTLVGKRCNRDATGARVTWSVNGSIRRRFKTGGGSYLSSHDPRVVLGLGPARKLDWVEIAWPAPSDLRERFNDLPIDRYTVIAEGDGQRV